MNRWVKVFITAIELTGWTSKFFGSRLQYNARDDYPALQIHVGVSITFLWFLYLPNLSRISVRSAYTAT